MTKEEYQKRIAELENVLRQAAPYLRKPKPILYDKIQRILTGKEDWHGIRI